MHTLHQYVKQQNAHGSGCHDHLAQLSSLASRMPWIAGGLSAADLLRGRRGHAGAERQVVGALRAGRERVAWPRLRSPKGKK